MYIINANNLLDSCGFFFFCSVVIPDDNPVSQYSCNIYIPTVTAYTLRYLRSAPHLHSTHTRSRMTCTYITPQTRYTTTPKSPIPYTHLISHPNEDELVISSPSLFFRRTSYSVVLIGPSRSYSTHHQRQKVKHRYCMD